MLRKAADQSVQMMGESVLDDSIRLDPNMFAEGQQSARRSSNKLIEKQSDDPVAHNSDEDRGDEIDIEELKIKDITLEGRSRQQTARRLPGESGRSPDDSCEYY